MIYVRGWNSYLKKLCGSPNFLDNIQTLITKKQVFTLEDIEFGVKWPLKGKTKDIEGLSI